MNGTEVKHTTRKHETFDGYLTGPRGGASVPGILIIPSIFGVDEEMQELADAWAADGFLVSAPDIFWRQTPGPTADMGVAFDRYGKFDPVQGMLDIEDLLRELKSRPQCNGKVALLGFCFGGRYALLAAARLGLDAAASFHGANMGGHVDEAAKVTCPVSFHFGDDDPIVPMKEVDAVQAAFAGRANADIGVYRGAGHGFAMPRKDGYHAAVAKESRGRVLRCFRSM